MLSTPENFVCVSSIYRARYISSYLVLLEFIVIILFQEEEDVKKSKIISTDSTPEGM